MFIRWQSRPRRRTEFGRWDEPDTHWRAILVENTRVGSADGRTRQRHIAYIAGFTESRAKIPTQRCYLWDARGASGANSAARARYDPTKHARSAVAIAAKLDALGNQISAETRATVAAAAAQGPP